MLLDIMSALLPTGATFVIGFVLLFLIYYFTTPIYTEYGDKRSRLIYSLINSLYFSLVVAIMLLVLPALSDSSGILVSVVVGIVIIMVSTLVQVVTITYLVKRNIVRMRQKRRKR